MTTIVKNIIGGKRNGLLDLLNLTIYGDCYDFAIAMHRNLDWSLIGLIDESKIIHVGVKTPKGEIWDGRGKVSEEEFGGHFISPPFIIQEVTEEELLATGGVREHNVELILRRAQLAWPDLLWKSETIQKRMADFADELEEISRKHKLWIGGMTPTSLPIVFEGFNDETGYAIKPNTDGNAFTINRVLE